MLHNIQRLRRYRFVGEAVSCGLCGSEDHDVISYRDRYFHPLRTVCCRHCGLVFTNPMPTSDEVTNYYKQDYRRHYSGMEKPDSRYICRAREGCTRRFEQLRPNLPTKGFIVDVGAAGGEFLNCAQEHGYQTYGIEPSGDYAEHARSFYGLTIHTGGWQDAPITAGSVDVVTIHHVLEHLREPLDAVRQFHQWLKPDGLLYISVPNVHRPDRTPMSRFHFAHIHNFTPKTLIMLGLRAGFEPLKGRNPETTEIIFRRLPQPIEDWYCFPESAEELAHYFRSHKTWKHLLRPTPYIRMGRRFQNKLRELGKSGRQVQ